MSKTTTTTPASTLADLEESTTTATPKQEPSTKSRVVVRRRRNRNRPAEIPVDVVLVDRIVTASGLPPAYSFEVIKTVQRIVREKAIHVALQMPEGLLLYATVLADVLRQLVLSTRASLPDAESHPDGVQFSILGDVTYGACCIDDLGAQALGCQLLVHYGHSCLVPVSQTVLPCLYVFCEIQFDAYHAVDCLLATLKEQQSNETPHVYLCATIQFRHALVTCQERLSKAGIESTIPQIKPLSPGEVLGCTAPRLGQGVLLFCADGRFHLEAVLIRNPHITAYRYDPYGRVLTTEAYDHSALQELRTSAIASVREASTVGIVLGTLGRQGNIGQLERIKHALRQAGKRSMTVLLSEITPRKLQLLGIKVWVQIACPRLSIDWGHLMPAGIVLANPYELYCALDQAPTPCLNDDDDDEFYPMDYYAAQSGPWTNYYQSKEAAKA